MTTATWAQVHVGDAVRGADQRAWRVTRRERGARWLGAGTAEDKFTLARDEGGTSREVIARRALNDPADVVERADHDPIGRAVAALLDLALTIEILKEETVTTTADPFTPPAAAQPQEETKRDRWGRYMLPHPETGKDQAWTRVSTIARTVADEYNLTLWKLRMVAKGIATNPDLIAGAAAADPEEDKTTLNKLAESAMERAESSRGANLGTAVHSFTQRLDRGEPLASLRAPAPLDADLTAYQATLKAAGLSVLPEYIERIVVLPGIGVAGTLDRVVRHRSGALYVLDLKTGKDLSYGWLEIALAQACYAHAPLVWDKTNKHYEGMPPVDQSKALVLHLPIGKAKGQIYGVDIIKGWKATETALAVRAHRSGSKELAWLVEPDDPASVAAMKVGRATSQADLARLWDEFTRRGLMTEQLHAAMFARMAEINTQQGVAA